MQINDPGEYEFIGIKIIGLKYWIWFEKDKLKYDESGWIDATGYIKDKVFKINIHKSLIIGKIESNNNMITRGE
jgi:hypothetical protein